MEPSCRVETRLVQSDRVNGGLVEEAQIQRWRCEWVELRVLESVRNDDGDGMASIDGAGGGIRREKRVR